MATRGDRRHVGLAAGQPKAAMLVEEKPVKVGDHSLDAGRYAIKTPEVLWRPLVRGALDLAA